MPTIPAGFAEATFIFRPIGGTRDVTWSLGLDVDDFGILPPDEIAQLVATAFTGTGKPYLPANMENSWQFLGVSVTKQLEEGPLTGEALQTFTGTISSGAAPINCAMLFTKYTGMGGRRNRGRAYVPPVGLGDSAVDAVGVITPSVVTFFQGLYNDALEDMVAAGASPVLFHQSAPFTPSPIQSMFLEGTIATQRRRLRR